MQEYHYTLQDLDNMIPWEREVYVTLLANHLEEKIEKMKSQKGRGF